MFRTTDRRTTSDPTLPPSAEDPGEAAPTPLTFSFTERHLGLGILLALIVLLLVGLAVGQLLGHLVADLVMAALP
ncbi:hypothetical protein [Nocardioides psychrotolerans]|uniref:hypothetical protein n=1 Tax=Nocardioides psychrotolerans TaxID=1005945 RepID=UPI003137A21B